MRAAHHARKGNAHVHEPPSLPPRYDAVLAAGAIIGYGGALVFLITQHIPGLRVTNDDVRFSIGLWCLAVSGPSAVCWVLRPRLIHLAYAMRLGLSFAGLPDAPDITPRRAFVARRWMWCSCGTIGACVWTLAAGLDIGAFTGKLSIHGVDLDISTLLLCQLGAVCECVRILGPSLAAVDEVYQAARRGGEGPGGTVLQFRRPTG